ncbi:hypothetical protein HMPREF3214_00357 [Alloscardovia omnicolens]|nr:hypothetical protein HMPREF3214_00357 [Alloscardovia omnicolens]
MVRETWNAIPQHVSQTTRPLALICRNNPKNKTQPINKNSHSRE